MLMLCGLKEEAFMKWGIIAARANGKRTNHDYRHRAGNGKRPTTA
jgi:hypothetical protein